MANSMLQAYGIIQKCLEIQEENRIDRFDALRSSVFYNLQTMDLGTAIYGNQSQEMDFINWCWDIVSLQNSCSVNVMKYQKKRKCFRFSFC